MRKARAFFFVSAGVLGLALLLPRPATATWPTDSLVNVPLCTDAGMQASPRIVVDGAGGAIVTWQDTRSGKGDIYAQRISATGAVQWAANGVALCTATDYQYLPAIVSDGAGGAIVTWHDYRGSDFDIYAQRISADGAVQWTADGVALCTATREQADPKIVPDGAGGAIVTWEDYRSLTTFLDIYAQRISADGVVQWATDGVALCAAAQNQRYPAIVSDGAGGVIVTWTDYRVGEKPDIYAQHMLATGVVDPAWPTDGRALCTAANEQVVPDIVSDGAGGAIVAWQDHRKGTESDIYAQRVLAGGVVDPAWPANGRALSTARDFQFSPKLVADGAGGAIATWWDFRSLFSNDIYAQHVLASGVLDPAWPAALPLCTAAGEQLVPEIVSDGAGGAIVTWYDYRSGAADIYAQRILAGGVVDPAWPANGRALCAAAYHQVSPTIVPDDAGGAIVTWMDYRSGTNNDIYAQAVRANGELGSDASVSVPGEVALGFALDPIRPNPSRGGVLAVRFALPGKTAASLELLDVTGRRIATCEVGSFGAGWHALDLGEGQHLAPGLYLVCLRQGTDRRVARVVVLK